MKLTVSEQLDTVTAAVVHDIGKLSAPKEIMLQDVWTDAEKERIKAAEIAGFGLIEHVFAASPNIKRICVQAQNNLECLEKGKENDMSKMIMSAKVLSVAETYDTMTAVQIDAEEASSEVTALRFLQENPKYFDEKVVNALCKSINILFAGVSVELNNGNKALVLVENPANILKPLVLTFGDNRLIDLSNRSYDGHLEIKDVMKTMDNRYVMDMDLLKRQGINVEEPVYAKETQLEKEIRVN